MNPRRERYRAEGVLRTVETVVTHDFSAVDEYSPTVIRVEPEGVSARHRDRDEAGGHRDIVVTAAAGEDLIEGIIPVRAVAEEIHRLEDRRGRTGDEWIIGRAGDEVEGVRQAGDGAVFRNLADSDPRHRDSKSKAARAAGPIGIIESCLIPSRDRIGATGRDGIATSGIGGEQRGGGESRAVGFIRRLGRITRSERLLGGATVWPH